jgi:hypothetical protein
LLPSSPRAFFNRLLHGWWGVKGWHPTQNRWKASIYSFDFPSYVSQANWGSWNIITQMVAGSNPSVGRFECFQCQTLSWFSFCDLDLNLPPLWWNWSPELDSGIDFLWKNQNWGPEPWK